MGRRHFTVKVEGDTIEALLEQAKLHGLPDVSRMVITVALEVSGFTFRSNVDELGRRVDDLFMGRVVEVKEEALPNT